MARLNVKYVDWGVANNFGTHIELHKDLINYPKIHDALLAHEKQHTKAIFSKQDFMLDMIRNPDLDYSSLWKFMLTRPKTLVQLIPIYWQPGRGFVYDINMLIIYLAMGLIIYANIYIWFIQ
jgi:hypothetical protein